MWEVPVSKGHLEWHFPLTQGKTSCCQHYYYVKPHLEFAIGATPQKRHLYSGTSLKKSYNDGTCNKASSIQILNRIF